MCKVSNNVGKQWVNDDVGEQHVARTHFKASNKHHGVKNWSAQKRIRMLRE